jgi:hypothetical protein
MLLTCDLARELDRRAIDKCGVPGIVLMENAGRNMAPGHPAEDEIGRCDARRQGW